LNDIGAAFVFGTFFQSIDDLKKASVVLHGNEPQAIFRRPSGYLLLTKFKDRYLRLLRHCKVVIAVSHYMKRHFLSCEEVVVSESKVKVVYAGVDTRLFKPRNTVRIRETLGIGVGAKVAISVARITREKGFDAMLHVFKRLIKVDPSYVWIVVGDGPHLQCMKAAVDKEGISAHVVFPGRVSREDLPDYYSASDVFWLLSEQESFGLVYVEAQLCGCPAIGYNTTGVAEAIQDGETGFLVEGDDECQGILARSDYCSLRRRDVVRISSQFSVDAQARRLRATILDEKEC
jgi:glycosyltransferase involved in cell wall biosynthesis